MQPINILVVDDSSTMRAMLRKIVRMSGVEVAQFYEAPNGLEGLNALSRYPVDLIMADLNMPEMGGLEMIDQIMQREEWKKIPIVVVSTESSSTRIDDIRARGLNFIHKPFTPERVREIIQPLLGGSAHAGE